MKGNKNIWKIVSIVLIIVILVAALVYGFMYFRNSIMNEYYGMGYNRGVLDADLSYKQQIISGIQQRGYINIDIPINETDSVTLTLVPYVPQQTQQTATGTQSE